MNHIPDGLIFFGAVAVITGIWWIYAPVAIITAGIGLAFLGYQMSSSEGGA